MKTIKTTPRKRAWALLLTACVMLSAHAATSDQMVHKGLLPLASENSQVHASAQPIKLSANTAEAQLVGVPDAAVVELPNGKHATAGEVRHELQQRALALQQMKKQAVRPPLALKVVNQRAVQALQARATQFALESATAKNEWQANQKKALPAPPVAQSLQQRQKARIFLKPLVTSINGKALRPGFSFTPGMALAIRGQGFGETAGSIALKGSFRKPVTFTASSWQDDLIYARVDDNISGEEDSNDVVLSVQPKDAAAIEIRGMQFVAARATVDVESIRQADVRFGGVVPKAYVSPASLAGFSRDTSIELPAQGRTATVYRDSFGHNTDHFQPGVDYFVLSSLRRGFAIESVELYAEVNDGVGDQSWGGTYRFGAYAPEIDDDKNFHVNWGSWRRHVTQELLVPSSDENVSCYRVTVRVIGPRGVPAFN